MVSNNFMNILIADDHSLVLEGLAKVLQNIPETGIIDIFTEGMSVCQILQTNRYDVYIIDLKMPDIDGFELINHIRAAHSDAKILVCTMIENASIINRLIYKNVDGVVFKSSSAEHLAKALKNISQGKKYFCPRFACLEKQYEKHRKKMGTDMLNLTQRELEVLGYIIEGMTSSEMAKKMGVSENGVEGFRKSLLEKTNVRNVAQLVAFAYENKLAG